MAKLEYTQDENCRYRNFLIKIVQYSVFKDKNDVILILLLLFFVVATRWRSSSDSSALA